MKIGLKPENERILFNAKNKVFFELSKKIRTELKVKDKLFALEDDIVMAIFEKVELELKNENMNYNRIVNELAVLPDFTFDAQEMANVSNAQRKAKLTYILKKEIEAINKDLQNIKDNFDDLHLYGDLSGFFKKTGYSVLPGRDKERNRGYVFYDTKRKFVLADG